MKEALILLEELLPKMKAATRKMIYTVLVIDDGKRDKTVAECDILTKEFGRILKSVDHDDTDRESKIKLNKILTDLQQPGRSMLCHGMNCL